MSSRSSRHCSPPHLLPVGLDLVNAVPGGSEQLGQHGGGGLPGLGGDQQELALGGECLGEDGGRSLDLATHLGTVLWRMER